MRYEIKHDVAYYLRVTPIAGPLSFMQVLAMPETNGPTQKLAPKIWKCGVKYSLDETRTQK